MTAQTIGKTWPCPYCRLPIEILTNVFVDGTNHLLDAHREILIQTRPVIRRTEQ